jgi:hypothetical protein
MPQEVFSPSEFKLQHNAMEGVGGSRRYSNTCLYQSTRDLPSMPSNSLALHFGFPMPLPPLPHVGASVSGEALRDAAKRPSVTPRRRRETLVFSFLPTPTGFPLEFRPSLVGGG